MEDKKKARIIGNKFMNQTHLNLQIPTAKFSNNDDSKEPVSATLASSKRMKENNSKITHGT